MQHHAAYHPAHLFMLRLWQEELDEGETEWRVQLRSIETGKICYFHDWPTLIHLLVAMLPSGALDARPQSKDAVTQARHGSDE